MNKKYIPFLNIVPYKRVHFKISSGNLESALFNVACISELADLQDCR